MGGGANSCKESDEPKKRLKKVRSVKLDRFRLSMKRTKSRLSKGMLLPNDSSEPKPSPNSKFQDAPNYMKSTSCFDARRGSLQPNNPGHSSIARKSIKRMHSLRRLRKLPSLKSGARRSSIHHDEVYQDQEKENTIKMGQPRLMMIRSGSIKVTRVKSIKLSRRRWSRSRLDQVSISMTDDEATEAEAVMRQKTINNSLTAAPTLWKMPSLRPKRRPNKKHSKTAEFDSATCSSALKSRKVPEADHVSGVCESENQLIGHVCPYTYCSLHGHLHVPSPPLKGFISTKRRLLKKQRSISMKNKVKTEATYRNMSRMNRSMQADMTENVTDNEGSNEEIFAEPRDVSSEACSVGSGDSEISTTTTTTTSAAESNILYDKKKYSNMWRLIYKHLSVPAKTSDTDNHHHGDENQDMNLDSQVEDSEKLEFNQAEAIEFVQQAVEEILHLDEESPLDMVDHGKQDFREHNEADEYPRELKDIQQPKRQRSKGFEKLRKMIITAKFIKAVEKLRMISPQKPRYLSLEEQSRVERVQLRHLSMDERKNSQGWMLDFALQQVIAKLGPAQQRRVGMLVQAFERVTPETSINCDPAANYTAPPTSKLKEERSIALDVDGSGLYDNIVQVPEGAVNLDASVATFVLEVDDNTSQHVATENPTRNKEEEGPCREILAEAGESPKQVKVGLSNSRNDWDSGSDNKPSNFSPVDDVPKQSILQEVDETRDESVSFLEAPLLDQANSPCEETNPLFDKEKFTNVWNMVYQKFIASEDTASVEKKVDVKERDEIVSASNSTEGSSESSLGQLDMKHAVNIDASAGTEKHEVNKANAIQLVQEAIDELLRLHEQLSDQQPSKVNKEGEASKENKTSTDAIGEHSHSKELKDTQTMEPERTDTGDQKALQIQLSKPYSKLKKLILSAKFITAMEKLRRVRACKTENSSSQGNSKAEKVYLRHLSMGGRRNSEEWMFDYALQQVVSKLAPAQQRRVALLTEAFETFTPELEQMSTKYRRVKMQPAGYTASTAKQTKEDSTFVSIDTSPEDALCCSDNIQVEHEEDTDFKAKHRSHQEQTLTDSQEDEHKINVPKDVIADRKYSKMWKLIYQQVKSNSSADGQNQTAEIRAKEDQTEDASVETDDEKLEITQSDAIKLVQEAVDGILLHCNSMEQPSEVVSKIKNEEDSKSEQNAFQGYSKLKRAIICSKFVTAMEKMQKLRAQKKRCHYNPHILDQKAETVHLRQCLMDERSNSEVWMLDYALRQVIAKLAPVQRKKVVMLIEAFEAVGPNPEETSTKSDIVFTAGNEDFKEETSLEPCQDLEPTGTSEAVTIPSLTSFEESRSFLPKEMKVTGPQVTADTHRANTSAGESSQSQDIGKDANTDSRNNNVVDGQKNSSMWRLIYQHIKSGIPNEEQIPTETGLHGPSSDAETLDEETPSDSHWSSTDNETADKNSDSANTELQQKDAIKLGEEAVNEILQMQVQSGDDQSINPEEKTREEDKARQELPRSYSVLSKAILCKKFIKAMEKMKKNKHKDQRYLPQQPDSPAENVRLRAQGMDEKNCEELMLDYALQQVIGKLAPTQKKKVSLLVEAFERVNPLPDSRRHQRLNAVA